MEKFRKDVEAKLQEAMDRSRQDLMKALLPAALENPPEVWRRADGTHRDRDAIARRLDETLKKAFGDAESLVGDMKVRLVFKGVTYESLIDENFVAAARKALPDLEQLHEEHLAARELAGPSNASPS